MTVQPTHWMEYGEPTDGRVEATYRITYQTGPNDGLKEDDVTEGTIPFEALEVWDESDHVHDDGSLNLSACDSDTREYLESVFEENE